MTEKLDRLIEIEKSIEELNQEFSKILFNRTDIKNLEKVGQALAPHSEHAALVYSRLLELDPGNIEYLCQKGFTYWMFNDIESAKIVVEEAKAIDPKNLDVLKLETAIERDPKKCLELYKNILKLYPNDEATKENLKNLEEQLAEPGEHTFIREKSFPF